MLEGKLPHDLGGAAAAATEDDEDEVMIQLDDAVTVHRVGGEEDNVLCASELLASEEWVKSLVELFSLEEYMPSCFNILPTQEEANRKELAELKTKADTLQKILCQRLKEHVGRRAISTKDSWVWKFAHKNLAVVSAFMILAGHTKSRIACIAEGDALLAPVLNKFIPCTRSLDHQGCYLFFDNNNYTLSVAGR